MKKLLVLITAVLLVSCGTEVKMGNDEVSVDGENTDVEVVATDEADEAEEVEADVVTEEAEPIAEELEVVDEGELPVVDQEPVEVK